MTRCLPETFEPCPCGHGIASHKRDGTCSACELNAALVDLRAAVVPPFERFFDRILSLGRKR